MKMTDKELYKAINDELFKDGHCIIDQWKSMRIFDGGKVAMFEALCSTKGNIRIRKPFKRSRVDSDGNQLFLYDVYRFTNKMELVDVGIIEDSRPKEERKDINESVKFLGGIL